METVRKSRKTNENTGEDWNEVELIFANIGLGLTLNGSPIVDRAVFSAIVIMIIATTMATPPALKWSLNRARLQ